MNPAGAQYVLNGTVRILRTATGERVVQQLVKDTWKYVDSPFWLALTPLQFAQVLGAADQRPAAPTPNAEDFL